MAGVSDYFSIGSTVACKTCYDKEIEGEVLAFDQQTKMLILSILLREFAPPRGKASAYTLRAQTRALCLSLCCRSELSGPSHSLSIRLARTP